MNLEFAYNILDILQTMWDAAKQMEQNYVAGNMEAFHSLSMDLWDSLVAVQTVIRQETTNNEKVRLVDACTCAMESLKDIKLLALKCPEKVEWKLAYELEPIIETAAMQFYYWGIVAENPGKWEEFRKFLESTEAFGLLKDKKGHAYQCDLIIQVVAYNHMDYTKLCVESVLKNLPRNAKTEIHLYNHGSSDGTKKYFESLESDNIHSINVAVNWALPGMTNKSIARGRYFISVSNDIIIGESALKNLYRCAVEHEDYGYIVPTTPAVSNLQSIFADYMSWEEFDEFTKKNNQYDERRHEQRVRLCNPVCIIPSFLYEQMTLEMYQGIFCNEQPMFSFPDDRLSLWMRRHGYKNILMKDAYCHHFGSVTVKEDHGKQREQEKLYLEGRKDFFKNYGIDSWGIGFCYDFGLFNAWKIPKQDNISILGLNCGIGSNSLKIKELLREAGGQNINLYNGTQKKWFLSDLQGISDYAFLFFKLSDIPIKTGRKKFHYIIAEEPIEGIIWEDLMQKLQEAGMEFDELVYKNEKNCWELKKFHKEL